MIEYIYRDIAQTVRYLPYGLVVGIPMASVFLWQVNRRRKRQQKTELSWFPGILFGIYLTVLVVITFLSREGGSRSGVIDLQLFSTWGINDRNDAFVIENIMLFIPYGFFYAWNFCKGKKCFKCIFSGAVVSLGIEFLQLVTGRGFFQIDDILTNILGTVIGCLLFRLLAVGYQALK